MRTARVALGALLIFTAACTDDGKDGGTASGGTLVDGSTPATDGTATDGTATDSTTRDTKPVPTAADGTPLPDDSLAELEWGDCPADGVSDRTPASTAAASSVTLAASSAGPTRT